MYNQRSNKQCACLGAKYNSNHSNVPPTAPMAILIFDSTSPLSQFSKYTWVHMSISRQTPGAGGLTNGVLTLKRDWICRHLPEIDLNYTFFWIPRVLHLYFLNLCGVYYRILRPKQTTGGQICRGGETLTSPPGSILPVASRPKCFPISISILTPRALYFSFLYIYSIYCRILRPHMGNLL